MKNSFFILLISLVVVSCGAKPKNKQTSKEKRVTLCPKIYTNNYTEILFDKYVTVVESDTISYNEIRYECIGSAFASHKVMYDKYGEWDRIIFLENYNLPILSWNNIDLFNDGREFTIYTFGIEEWKHIYASIMVFDMKSKDVLEDEYMRGEIAERFSYLIKNNDSKNKVFYDLLNEIRNPN
ncbi:MAG: hypothetical protein ACI863_001120 [Flavobacteriales bacterium]|jgi:hypothetical protein